MTDGKIDRFAGLLLLSAEAGTLRSVTFHSPSKAAGDELKTRGELRAISGKTVLQLETSLTEGRVKQTNLSPERIRLAAAEAFVIYRKADLVDAGGTVSLMISKKGAVTLLQKGRIGEADPSGTSPQNSSPRGNDREKRRLLDGSEPFLIALGISDAGGRVHDRMQSKFRQIARFSEYVAEAEPRLGREGELYVCDLCCGKSYLSFAAYHTLTAVCGRKVKMDCVDLKASVMETCAGIARDAGFDGMRFHAMNIGDFAPERTPELVISLHACDTATDLVLDFAVEHGARFILSTPCCQRELNRGMDCPPLAFAADVPILRQKLASAATDALRLLKLEAEGYRCDATELIDPEDTPKNVMLRAERRADFDPSSPAAAAKREEYRAALSFLFGEKIPAHWLLPGKAAE